MDRTCSESMRVQKPVGITGGIGSGKSSVARFCKEQFGVQYINADEVCRDLLAPGEPGWKDFVSTFGETFLLPGQAIDRQKLRKTIFQDHKLRERLGDLVHPLAKAEIKYILAQTDPFRCLVEVPLLYEVGWEDDFRAVIVVYATDKCCLNRLMQRDHLSLDAATEAIESQLSLTEKASRADHVIDNSGDWSDTCKQVLKLGKTLWGAGW